MQTVVDEYTAAASMELAFTIDVIPTLLLSRHGLSSCLSFISKRLLNGLEKHPLIMMTRGSIIGLGYRAVF